MTAPTARTWQASLTLVCLLILLLSVLRVAWSAYTWDATYDEYWHLLWSERALLDGNFDREYPNFISTTPVTMVNAAAKAAFQAFGVHDTTLLYKASRLPTVIGYGLLLLLVFLLGRHLTDPRTGLLAASLTALDANVATHGALTTVDVFFALITLGFVYQCLRFVRNPSPLAAAGLAAVTGLAFTVKLSAVLFLPTLLFVLLFALARQGVRAAAWRLPLYLLLGTAVVCVVINAAYRFHDVGFFLKDLRVNSNIMRTLQESLPLLYLPLPQAFIIGFDETLLYERVMQWNTVIFDRYLSDGVWYYFPVTWFFKTPIALLVLLSAALAAAARLWIKRTDTLGQRATTLWTATVKADPLVVGVLLILLQWLIFFVYFNFIFRTHVGLRYIIMCLPLLYLLAALALARLIRAGRGTGLVVTAMVVALLEHIPFWNNSLSFSNLFIPDKKTAYYYLTDSNIDWGQNYSRVMTRIREDYPDAAFNPVHILPGQNVIRLNYLAGVFRNFEQHRWVRTHLRPSAHVLHTHLVYDVSDEQFTAFLAAEHTAEGVSGPTSCPTVVTSLPYTNVVDSPRAQALCFENMNIRVRVELAGGSGTLGKVSARGDCEGLTLVSGQYVVYQLAAPFSRLCLASQDPNTRWLISEFRAKE